MKKERSFSRGFKSSHKKTRHISDGDSKGSGYKGPISFHKNTKSTDKPHKRYASNEKDYIFWCTECNVPLLEKECNTCKKEGIRIDLSQPADVRPCFVYEREVLHELLMSSFDCDPLGQRVILLNKIPGDDKTDEVIVDGLLFGILRFDIQKMGYVFEPSVQGAGILLKHTELKTVVLKKSPMHLNGKKVRYDHVEHISEDVRKNDIILVRSGSLTGFGIAYADAMDAPGTQGPVLRVRKIDSQDVSLSPRVPSMGDVVAANVSHIRNIGKNAINTIKGIANQKEHRQLPVNVSFSGGKDSLVVLDLTLSALRHRNVQAFFLNTGIEFPQTVEYARKYCRDNNIELIEKEAVSSFWDNVDTFGPPAKDFRWCCKICKLAPANAAIEECLRHSHVCITVDGKRRYESFSRAGISTSETNPFVPGQLNIFPIKNWKALEVWLYIYWRGLDYNPLYDMGFERVGCYLCPAALSAEYERLKELHPKLYDRWNSFLVDWAARTGRSRDFVSRGMWRWKELPPKMLKLCGELGISVSGHEPLSPFGIDITSGVSPCRAGGYSIEGSVHGLSMKKSGYIMNIIGSTSFSEELGLLLVKKDGHSAKLFSSGSLVVNADDKEGANRFFAQVLRQLQRVHKCKGCGVCINTCHVNAISLSGIKGDIQGDMKGKDTDHCVQINEQCTRCNKCTDVCVILKYEDKIGI